MQNLGKNYPKVIYDIAIFEFGKHLAKTKEKRGMFAYLPPSQILEGAKCKMVITTVFSGSNYPKFIYGMPPKENKFKIQFEFEFKFKIEILNRR